MLIFLLLFPFVVTGYAILLEPGVVLDLIVTTKIPPLAYVDMRILEVIRYEGALVAERVCLFEMYTF